MNPITSYDNLETEWAELFMGVLIREDVYAWQR